MALPIAHATAGYVVHRLDRRTTGWAVWPRGLAFMAIGNLPDADFVIGFLLGRPGAFHRGVSHSVLAALVFAVVAGTFVWWRRWDRWWPAALLCGSAYATHLLVDFFTIDQRPPAGAPFLWPLSDAYYLSPVTFFGEILIDGRSREGFLRSVFAWPTIGVLAREALVAVVSVGALALLDAARGGGREAPILGELGGPGEEDVA